MTADPPLFHAEGITCEYRSRAGLLGKPEVTRAVDNVSFSIGRGESFAVVGESGCGKSTLARAILALERPVAGRTLLRGEDMLAAGPARLRQLRRDIAMVFQDPYDSLDPRLRVGSSIADPLAALHPDMDRATRRTRVAEMLEAVGLKPADAAKYPHEFSGGQRQRIAIARAFITRPALIVADEPTSALDVSVQAQVLDLMRQLQRDFGVSYLFISHNLAVVRQVTDRVAVMQRGRFVETGPVAQVFANPTHDYTRSLLASVLDPRPRQRA